MSDGGKEFDIEIPMEEGEPLGATPNDKLVVIKVQSHTLADGKLKIGDQILRINGVVVSDQASFFKQLRFAPPLAKLTVYRDARKADELAQRIHIPADREKNIMRRDGFQYLIAKLTWKAGGPKLGLGIKHYQNRVLVSRCDNNSLSAAHLSVGDHIVDLNGFPVTDKDVARDILLKSLQGKGEVSILIERPETMEAKHWTQNALTVQVGSQPPSVQMNSDVQRILHREREKLKAKKGVAPPPSILRQPKSRKPTPVSIKEETISNVIASDNEGKMLRGVRK